MFRIFIFYKKYILKVYDIDIFIVAPLFPYILAFFKYIFADNYVFFLSNFQIYTEIPKFIKIRIFGFGHYMAPGRPGIALK